MKGTLLKIPANDSEIFSRLNLKRPPEYTELTAVIGGGYLEIVPYFKDIITEGVLVPCVAMCDEEGKLKRFSINTRANIMWQASLTRQYGPRRSNIRDVLVGDVLVIFGDPEFMESL